MRSHSRPKESASGAARPFFSRSIENAPVATPFFMPSPAVATPDVQAEQEETLQPKEASEPVRDAKAPDSPPPEETNGRSVQPKLAMGVPGDRFEQEADAVADRVVQRMETRSIGGDDAPPVQAKCANCLEEEDKLRRKDDGENDGKMPYKRSEPAPGSAPQDVTGGCTGGATEGSGRKALTGGTTIQAKLSITPPDDPQEREADQVANTIMRMPAPDVGQGLVAASGVGGGSLCRKGDETTVEDESIQRKCDECKIAAPSSEEQVEDQEPDLAKDTDTGTVSPKSEPGGPTTVSDELHSALRSARGNGWPLPTALKASMESRFGEDFSAVRIHANSASAAMTKSIHAQAFTYGSDIFFNPSRYDPGSTTGQTLLAHELTHVIQQKGTHPLQRKIQRAEEFGRIGNWAHEKIQERLRSVDDKLITEAGIPGATRRGKKINNAGFADLYKSQGSQISGVQAEIRGNDDVTTNIKYTYKNFLTSGKRLKNIKSRSAFHIGPRIKKDKTWDFTHNFPAMFEVGELKPLFPTEFTESLAYHGTAPLQVDSYIEGFREFVEQVHKDKGVPVPATITGKPIDIPEDHIPDSINYRKFEQEHARTDEHTILKNKNVRPKETTPRVWVYQFKPGLFVYFLITHPYTKTDFPQAVDKQLQRLDPLLKELRAKHPKMGTSLKREVGGQGGNAQTPTVSRKHGKRIQAKDDDSWTQAAEQWEKKRKAWARGDDAVTPKPKQFLKEQAKGIEKKAKVDKELKLTPSKAEKERAKQVKDIRFWSSFKGRIFGALYFRFRKVFVKIEDLFNKIKAKFQKHRGNAAKLNDKGGIFDNWKRVATKAIIRLAVEIFKDMVGIAFTRFMNCINAIVEGITDKYVKAIEEEVQEEAKKIEPLCCGIMVFKNQFDAEVEKHEKLIVEFTEAVHTIKQWREILNDVEIAVRIGVQVVSCGTPPGLGCLWGLVAQLGISAGLSLLTRTSYFDDYIAKPAATALMDAIVGDKLHNLMVDVLEATPLKPHMAGLSACARAASGGGGVGNGIGGHLDKLDPNDPAIAKARQEWEAAHKDEILKDLQEVFEKGDKTSLTEDEIKKLVDALKSANKTPEELKKMLQAARNPKTGKLDLDKAQTQVSSGIVPEDTPKDRKIDYRQAQRLNSYYEQKIGWDPTTFIKQPSIQANSKEFADAVYDMQQATGAHADGVAGPGTTVKFYQANKLPKDATYAKAVKVGEQEEQARADKKAAEARRKEIEALLKDEKVKAALDVPFPSDEQLKKDLTPLSWQNLEDGSAQFIQVNGRAIVGMKTDAGHRLGAYFHYVEREFNGVKMNMIVKTSRFYVLDRMSPNEIITFSVVDKDRQSGLEFLALKERKKDSFFEMGPYFFGRFVEIQ